MQQVYRYMSNGLGVYTAVEANCPRNDARRNNKPDGSWLPRMGKSYPGAISYWTERGLAKYIRSGLQNWHSSVINDPVEVHIADRPNSVLYADEYQVIAMPDAFTVRGCDLKQPTHWMPLPEPPEVKREAVAIRIPVSNLVYITP